MPNPNQGVPPGAKPFVRKKKGTPAPRRKLRQQAMSDIKWSFDPLLDQLQNTERDVRRDYRDTRQQANSIYDALGTQLAPLAGQYDAQAQAIQNDLAQRLGSLTGMINQTPGAENAAAAQMFGTLGAGGQQLLASDRMRNLGYQTSTQRQAGLDRQSIQSRFLDDFREAIDDLKQNRLDVKGDFQSALMARLDELRQKRWERNISELEYELRKDEIADARNFRDEQTSRSNRMENKSFRQDQRERRANRNYAETLAETELDKTLIKPIKKHLTELEERLQSINQTIEKLSTADAWDTTSTEERQKLINRRKNVKRKIRRKRNRIREIKKKDQIG